MIADNKPAETTTEAAQITPYTTGDIAFPFIERHSLKG